MQFHQYIKDFILLKSRYCIISLCRLWYCVINLCCHVMFGRIWTYSLKNGLLYFSAWASGVWGIGTGLGMVESCIFCSFALFDLFLLTLNFATNKSYCIEFGIKCHTNYRFCSEGTNAVNGAERAGTLPCGKLQSLPGSPVLVIHRSASPFTDPDLWGPAHSTLCDLTLAVNWQKRALQKRTTCKKL